MFTKLADLLQKQVRLTACNMTTGFCKFPGICSKQVRNLYDIKIQFGDNQVYNIPSKGYIYDALSDEGYPECRYRFNKSDNNDIILGTPFLYNYY
jgi:hypothetical protein